MDNTTHEECSQQANAVPDLDQLGIDLAEHHPPHSVAITMRLARRKPEQAQRIAAELAAHRARLGFISPVKCTPCPCELGDCPNCLRDDDEAKWAREPTTPGRVYDLFDGEVF